MLLPLDLRVEEIVSEISDGDTVAELLSALPKTVDMRLVRALAGASADGAEAVTGALVKRLEEVLNVEDQP